MYFNHTSAHLSKKTVSGFAQAAIADDKSIRFCQIQSGRFEFPQQHSLLRVCNRPNLLILQLFKKKLQKLPKKYCIS